MKIFQICLFDVNYLISGKYWWFGNILVIFIKVPYVTLMYMCIVLQVLALSLCGIFPGLLGQFISVMYLRQTGGKLFHCFTWDHMTWNSLDVTRQLKAHCATGDSGTQNFKSLTSLHEKSHDQDAAGPFHSCLFSGLKWYMHPLKQFIFLNPSFRTEL